MRAFYLWGKGYQALSEIDTFFDKIFYRTKSNSSSIDDIINFVKKNNIDYIVIQNPYVREDTLYFYKELKKRNLKLIISDRGALPNSWFFDLNGFNADSKSYESKHWDHHLPKPKEKKVIEYIQNTISTDISLEEQGKRIGAENLRNKLNINKDKKILFVPLQRPNDTVIKYFSKNVNNMDDFLQKIVAIQKNLEDDWVVLIKKHPLENKQLYKEELRYVDNDTHFKDLLELCDAVMLINSGVGVTAMMYQKPVYHFGDIFYSHLSFNKEVKNTQEAIKYLKGNLLKVDIEKVKRFISFLLEDFYSFGEMQSYKRTEKDGSLSPIITEIKFSKINLYPISMNKKTLIVTDIRFWDRDIGNRQILFRRIQYLKKYIDLHICILQKISNKDKDILKSYGLLDLTTICSEIPLTQEELKNTAETKTTFLESHYVHHYKVRFNKFLEKHHFDNIFLQYIRLDYLVNDLFSKYKIFIDTYDVMAHRTEAYKKHGDNTHHIILTEQEENAILGNYDYVLGIQKNDTLHFGKSIGHEKCLTVPHAIDSKNIYRNRVKIINLNFISGRANYKHIIWFIEKIWGYFSSSKYRGLTLNIFGSVCEPKYLGKYSNLKNIILHGPINDIVHAYKNADIMINPVLYGGGLKVKNVEAMAHGIPLITTDEGANGIEDGINYSFLLANTIDEWIEAILYLKKSKKLREELSQNSIKYANYHFSDDMCFSKFTRLLQE